MSKEMTKYDVMNQKMVDLVSSIMKSVVDDEKEKVIDGDINDDVINLKKIQQWYKDLIVVCHLCYEATNDFLQWDKEELIRAVSTGKVTISDLFQVTRQDEYAKVLLCNAILESHGFNYSNDSVVARVQQTHETQEDLSKSFYAGLSDEEKSVIAATEKDNFSMGDLPDSYKQILDEYHSSFMNQYIYPEVTTEQTVREKALAATKTLENSRNINLKVKLLS